ncbi:MAG TPA: S9 family peptidase [Candidatus Eisenbacteria bacterium]|nr:S9 family peptidase [Candidatus Eisenbacteria bacterium]
MTVASTPTTTLYPARKGPRPLSAEDLWTLPRVGAPEPAPDGTALVVPVTTWLIEKNESRTRLWLVPLDGAAPRALTRDDLSSSEPAFSPDGTRLAFTRKHANGKPQLHVLPLTGGEPECLTELPLGVFDPRWLPDGSGIVFGAKLIKGHLTPEATRAELERREKDPVKVHVTEDRLYRYWDTWLTTGEVPHLFRIDLATRAIKDLTPESTLWFDWMEPAGQYDISPDGREIAFAAVAYDADKREQRSAIYTVPASGGAVTCITPDHPAGDHLPRYSPDGRMIVYGAQQDPYFYADQVRIMAYDRQAKTHTRWIKDWTLSPAHWTFAADGTLLLEVECEGRVDLWACRDGSPRRVARGGTISGAHALKDGRVAFSQQTLVSPPEVFVVPLDNGAPRRVTTFTDEVAARFGLGEVREIEYEGAYGEKVQMFLVLPPGFETGKTYPLVQVIHGGPHGISGDSFHWRWNAQAFAAPGYVAALVNFQGSTSWGQDFAKRIQGSWGDRPFQDVMLATDLLLASGLVDGKRMAAAGGSYGGYMASWIEGHTDRFKCIVNHAGVYNTLSQYASDWTMGRHQAFGGEPWGDLDAITRWNPAHAAKGFVTPMLVLHGEKDYRVPVTQGLECYGVLKAKGVPARLVYFPDENHWILKPRNSLVWYREVLGWLERWLGKS